MRNIVTRASICLSALLATVLFAGAAGAAGADKSETLIRTPQVAGIWYPSDPPELSRTVDNYLDQTKPVQLGGRVVAILVPHAPIAYSGRAAGAAWALARSMHPAPQTIILVGPSQYPLDQPSVWPGGMYSCPLGLSAIDSKTAHLVSNLADAMFLQKAHLKEPGIEVQLPFIKRTLPKAKLVPMLTHYVDFETADQIAKALARASKNQNTLLAAVSNLSGGHPEADTIELDEALVKFIEDMDAKGLARAAKDQEVEAKGLQAILSVMIAAKKLGAKRGVILSQYNSTQITGDRDKVYGFASAAWIAPDPKAGKTKSQPPAPHQDNPRQEAPPLNQSQKDRLRQIAKQAVTASVMGRPLPILQINDPALRRRSGVFVTLYCQGLVRGSMGTIYRDRPLAQAVAQAAMAAARDDSRYDPVQPEELGALEIKISVLSPLKPCQPDELRPGVDGAFLGSGDHEGLLLPFVAAQTGWNRTQFLSALCKKAGLGPQCWQKLRITLQRFQAQTF